MSVSSISCYKISLLRVADDVYLHRNTTSASLKGEISIFIRPCLASLMAHSKPIEEQTTHFTNPGLAPRYYLLFGRPSRNSTYLLHCDYGGRHLAVEN